MVICQLCLSKTGKNLKWPMDFNFWKDFIFGNSYFYIKYKIYIKYSGYCSL